METSAKKIVLLSIGLTLVGFLALPFLMCKEVSSGGYKHRTIPVGAAEDLSSPTITETDRLFLYEMYSELVELRETDQFRIHGFSQDGPYYYWTTDLQNWIQGNPGSAAVSTAQDLIDLGNMYVRTYGVDNYLTTGYRESLEVALYPPGE